MQSSIPVILCFPVSHSISQTCMHSTAYMAHVPCREPQYFLTAFSEAKSNPMLGVPSPPAHPSAKKKKVRVCMMDLCPKCGLSLLTCMCYCPFMQKGGSSEFYYTDQGILSDCIRHSEMLANDLADNALHMDEKGMSDVCTINL